MELSRRDGDWRAVCTEERGSEVTRWLLHFRQGMLVAWTEAAMDKSLLMVSSVGLGLLTSEFVGPPRPNLFFFFFF